ncbi:MAG: TIR domain-containing protein [Bacteroidales bacterium]|nr:TIR domain-containing protein [Bacteroidales bacterium]
MKYDYDVFISYSSKDQKVAEGICGYLERYRLRCFVAYRDIPKGKVWAAAITDGIDDSAMMVVVFSQNFNSSKQVDREIELAAEDNKPILTYRITDDPLQGAKKYYLKNLNWIDAFPNPQENFGELYDNVCKLLGKTSSTTVVAQPLPESKQKPSSLKACQNKYCKNFGKYILPSEARFCPECGNSLSVLPEAEAERQRQMAAENERKVGGHEYVDLGLPSGTLWATCNVGANRPEDYGNYYAWGETNTKNNYIWSTYKWCRGSKDSQTKYNTQSSFGTVDNRTVLEMSDDAAHVSWGAGWRMPTKEEWKELNDKCTRTWTTQGGKNGYRVTGPNGKSIFLPAAGLRNVTSLNDAGSFGYYWSSSLDTGFPYCAYFQYLVSFFFYMSKEYIRCLGFTVRPVCPPQD